MGFKHLKFNWHSIWSVDTQNPIYSREERGYNYDFQNINIFTADVVNTYANLIVQVNESLQGGCMIGFDFNLFETEDEINM